jgi:hypothetical protein
VVRPAQEKLFAAARRLNATFLNQNNRLCQYRSTTSWPREILRDHLHLEEIARLSDLASSYCKSLPLAASRGDKLTLAVHCRQVALVIHGVFTLVQEPARETEGSSL